MAVVSRAIPTLLRGISQAADVTKQADHADIQDNADSNPVLGLVKRSGLQYITNLSSSTLGNVHIQTINRDVNERYVAIFSNGNVKVYDIDGTEKTVNKPDGTTYLNTSDPRSVIKTVTVADYTFVVNTSITAAMDSTLSLSSANITQAVVFINQVSDKTTYSLTVDGVTVTDDTSSDSTLSTTQVATDLVLGLNSGLTGFTIVQNGPVVHIKKTDGSNFSIDGNDTQGNTHMTVVKDSVQRFTDLPTVSPNGYVVEVKGDENTDFDNYYVKFVTNNGNTFEEGQWEECVAPGIEFKFNYDTMPHVLIRQADGDFRFARVDGDSYGTSLQNSATFTSTTPNSATFTSTTSNNLVTITKTNHGFNTGQLISVESNDLTNGQFIITKTNDNTFTYVSAANEGSHTNAACTISDNLVTITRTNHGFITGQLINVESNDLTNGQFIIEKIDNNSFSYVSAINEGSHTNVACTVGLGFTLPKWGERTVGDLDSAPNPSFIGSKINNVFFFRNRLGFLADDNVVLSRAAEFFNFFPETVLSVIDSEPIDIAASHTKVAILRSAVTVEQELILFSDQTQFVLTSSTDNLTPRTANVVVVTEFESDDDAQPVGAGSSIYYLSKRGSFANVREYVYQRDLVIKESSNITVHVPKLIPSNIFKFAVSTSADVLVCLGTDNPNKLYINRWLYGQQYQKILNSWSTFTINENRSIKNVDFIGSDLFLVIEEANGTTLEKIPFENDFTEANATFEYRLDHKVTEATTGVSVAYNSSTDTSTFTVPYRLRADMNVVGRYLGSGETSTFVNPQNITTTLKPGQLIATTNTTNGSTSTITATGDYRNSKFIIGEPYEMHYRFSQQRLTEAQGGSSAGEILSGRLQLHHFYIKFEDTGFFKVEVTPENRDTSTHKFTGRFLGAASSTIGSVNLESGSFKVPVMSRADRVNIDVKNDTFLPTKLASAEYEAMFHMRSRRI